MRRLVISLAVAVTFVLLSAAPVWADGLLCFYTQNPHRRVCLAEGP